MLESTTGYLMISLGGPNLSLKLVILVIMVKNVTLLPEWLSGMTAAITAIIFLSSIPPGHDHIILLYLYTSLLPIVL